IQVTALPVGFGGYWDQLQVEAVAGNTPDVFTANEAWIAPLSAGGVLADLSAIPTMDLSAFSADALGTAVGAGGEVFAIPTGGNAQAMFVNLDILEAAGIPVPDDANWSWDDFHEISRQVSEANLTNSNGAQVWGNAGLSAQGPARVWANQTDGGMFTSDGNLNWSEQSMEELLALQADMIASGAAPSATIQNEDGNASAQDTLMGQGQVAFWSQWSNLLPAVAAGSPDANFALLRFPGDHTSSNMGTWLNPSQFFAQSSNAQYPEAAACLINFMVNNADAASIMGIDRGVPFNPEMVAVVEPDLSERDAMVAAFMSRIAYDAAASTPLPELSEDLNHFTIASADSVLFGLATPAEAAATLRTDLQNALVN
ncbi:MAG: extracellular solute-binding protein, partial [Promicromonosporaceae bacterium]|nr:extracellular solute-binding protein [Promicromonosporaceae bacterium]